MKKNAFGIGLVCAVVVIGLYFSGYTSSLLSTIVNDKRMVTLHTNYGDIKVKLYLKEAPEMSKNFLTLAQQKKYDGTIFHRVIDGFMIQGGDYENFNGTGGTSYTGEYLKDEFAKGLSNVRGAVSMANKGPDTNGSQFFVVQKDAVFLDGRHSVFGKVISGMEVVDAIAAVKTDERDAPVKKVVIESVDVR